VFGTRETLSVPVLTAIHIGTLAPFYELALFSETPTIDLHRFGLRTSPRQLPVQRDCIGNATVTSASLA
jgi:hypothetical protein